MRDVQRQVFLSSEWKTKVPDEQIQERLMELISSDGFAYGYRKLDRLLAPRIPVTDQ
ncbi:hypothetical protein P7H20_01675 [Paenibacillus larvae]|nr:hypothetical protein [Paenibacillus larvae]MDT2273860.1 hypothetical protein [Paenibacillus larvae]